MATSCIIKFGRSAILIREDATFALQAGGIASFGDVDDLGTGLYNTRPYATYEPDFWKLDGNYKFAPSANAHGAWVSDSLSQANTNFATAPELRITFTQDQDTNGLTLYFSAITGDWADSITITFRNSGGSVIRSDTYTPTSAEFATNQAVSNFRRIDVFLNSTNKAQRRARLKAIDFDVQSTFSGTEIISAKLIEEIDPLAIELPINTLEVSLLSTDGDFSIIEPAGEFANFQDMEPLDVYEDINGALVYMGRYYLKEWESKSENEADLRAVDAIGLLDEVITIGFDIPDGIAQADDMINELMTLADLQYELDASYSNVWLSGWIPVTTCREALQQICFALGAIAKCTRSKIITIEPMTLASDLVAFDHTIENNAKALSSPVQLTPLVTGVEISAHFWTTNGDEAGYQQVFQGTLGVGTHRIFFDGPTWQGAFSVTGGSWSEAGANYIDIGVAVPGTVTILASPMIDTTKAYNVHNGSLPAGTKQNIVKIADALLVTHRTDVDIDPQDVAQRVYDYFQQRYLQRTKLFASTIAPGESVLIRTQNNRQIAGIVERMESDLARGMVSDVEIVGVLVAV